MTEYEILKRRVEILEEGFQEIIALIKKDGNTNDNDDEYGEYNEEQCDGCGRALYDNGHCPMCCGCGMYTPGSEECDFCEHSDECSEHAANLMNKITKKKIHKIKKGK